MFIYRYFEEEVTLSGEFHDDEDLVLDLEDVKDFDDVRVFELRYNVQLPGKEVENVLSRRQVTGDDFDSVSGAILYDDPMKTDGVSKGA